MGGQIVTLFEYVGHGGAEHAAADLGALGVTMPGACGCPDFGTGELGAEQERVVGLGERLSIPRVAVFGQSRTTASYHDESAWRTENTGSNPQDGRFPSCRDGSCVRVRNAK